MKVYRKILWFLMLMTSVNSRAEVYKPYLVDNPERLEFVTGYCENKNQEKKLWFAINKTAKSIVDTLPAVPPEQKNYIETELESKNMDRFSAIKQTSIYRINEIRMSFENIEKLSRTYIDNHKNLKFEKKVEITGRVLLNINQLDGLKFFSFEKLPFKNSLTSRNYIISDGALDDLVSAQNSFGFLKDNLIFHLICYGEKSN
jgi:hypothetical protein